MSWERDLDEARERFAALDAERDLASALEHATPARFVQPFSGFFLPLPHVAQSILSLYGAFWDEPDEEYSADRVHFDAQGRPVAQLIGGSPTGDGDGLIDEADNRPGSLAQVFATDDPVEAFPDDGDLTERRVVPKSFLTLPSGWGAREAVGLDPFELTTYEELASTLNQPTWIDDRQGHWIGGHVSGAEGGVDELATTLLLHIEDDEDLGFSYLDAGTIQYRIPPDALAAQDWSRIVATAESS